MGCISWSESSTWELPSQFIQAQMKISPRIKMRKSIFIFSNIDSREISQFILIFNFWRKLINCRPWNSYCSGFEMIKCGLESIPLLANGLACIVLLCQLFQLSPHDLLESLNAWLWLYSDFQCLQIMELFSSRPQREYWRTSSDLLDR